MRLRKIILLLALCKRPHQQRDLALKLALLLRARMLTRERNYLIADSLISNADCAWTVTYSMRSEGSFINTVSIPPSAFDYFLSRFELHYQVKSGPGRRGRPPRFVSKNGVLACLLHYYTAAVEKKTLCELFGVPPSTLSRVMCRAEKALEAALDEVDDAAIRWPSFDEQREWAAAVQRKEPLVAGCFCFADGKNYDVQEPTSSDVQNALYNGWLHAVKITGVLCYGVDGTLIWGRHNYPGSWNDGEMSRQLQIRLADPTKTWSGGRCATDSAFPVSSTAEARIITPNKDGDLERASAPCRPGMVAMSNAITSIRQAAEWGMGSAEKCYRELMLPLPFDSTLRARRLRNIYHLYNLRVRTTGISQIRSSFP